MASLASHQSDPRQQICDILQEMFGKMNFEVDAMKALVASVVPEPGVTLAFSVQINSSLAVRIFTGGKKNVGDEGIRVHLPGYSDTKQPPHIIIYDETEAALARAYDVLMTFGHTPEKVEKRRR
jgi:hypothetical protein